MQKFSKVFTLMVAMLALAYCAVSCKVNVDDEPTLYTVTVASSIEHGKVSVDKSSAGAGTIIKLTATADEGYQLDSYSVKDASSNAITVTDGTFSMPKSNVTVSAMFELADYDISLETENGNVLMQVNDSDVSTANYKDIVTLIPDPDMGYSLVSITVTDENGEEVALAPGQTIVSAVPAYGNVEY